MNLQTFKNCLIPLIVLSATIAHAEPQFGGWTGSGEIYEDRLNPWFMSIEQTNGEKSLDRSFLTYCIQVDATNFGMTESQAKIRIENAFEFWSQEFLRSDIPNNPGNYKVFIGSITPVYQPKCTETTHLRFLLGTFESPEQRHFLEDLGGAHSFAGIAVRTSYGMEKGQLVGRGYIYFSPESGPDAMQGEQIVPNAWSSDNNIRFDLVLRHELGHVYGISHTGSETDLMGAEFPERVVKSKDKYLPSSLNVLAPTSSRIDLKNCTFASFTAEVLAFFGVPSDTKCFWFKTDIDKKLEIWATNEITTDRKKFHIAQAGQVTGKEIVENQKLIRVWLNDEQRKLLLPNFPAAAGNILYGAMQKRIRKSAQFTLPSTGTQHFITIDETPQSTTIGAALSNRISIDVLHE